MAKPIGISVIKGKTIDTHLETEQGRQLLAWLVSLPVEEGKFKDWTIRRNAYIREKMGEFKEVAKVSPQKAIVAEIAISEQKKGYSEAEKLILEKLDTILDLLSKKGVAWDEPG